MSALEQPGGSRRATWRIAGPETRQRAGQLGAARDRARAALALLDGTVVSIALPRIGRDFGAGLTALQWVVTAYTLTLAGLLLLAGSLGDRFGRKRVFIIGVVWFALASLLRGVAPDAPFLIATRALQGVGGALLTPGSLAILQASSVRRTAAGRSAPGPASAASARPSGRSSAAGWCRPARGG